MRAWIVSDLARAPKPKGRFVPIACGAIACLLRITPIFDPDYFWHLHTGRYIAEHRSVPSVDPFSHTFFGRPWKFVDWLSDLFMWGLHRLGGHGTVLVVFAFIGALSVALSIDRARRVVGNASTSSLLAIGGLVTAAVVFRITPRPQTLTLALFAVELLLLERARSDHRALYALPPLLALWQNMHGSAILGWLAVLAFATGVTIDVRHRHRARGAWLATAASAIALFIAVRPITRFLAGFDHVGDKRVATLFAEWAPLWSLERFSPSVAAFALLLVIAISLLALRVESEKVPLDRAMVGFGMSLLAIGTMRFVPFAAIAIAPIALRALDRHLERVRMPFRIAGFGLAFGSAGVLLGMQRMPIGIGIDHALFPEESARFVARAEPRGRMWNDFHYGGYLMFTLGDAYPVFVDGRSMAVFGVDFVWQVALADEAHIDALLRRYDVAFVIAPTGKRIDWFQRRPGWSIVHFDDVSFVAVREDAQPESVRALAYRRLHPASYWEDIESLERDRAALPAARLEAERAVAESPTSSIAHVALAAVCMAEANAACADAEIATAIRLHPEAIRGHRIKAMRCMQTDDRACACVEAKKVLSLAPTNEYARRLTAALACR